MNYLIVFPPLALGCLGAWFISRFAYQFGLLDIPNDRSSHSLPTPRGGGIGILIGYIVSSILLRLSFGIWLPAVALAVVSFFDDKLNLSPRTRLFSQFVSALFVAGVNISYLHLSLLTLIFIIFYGVVIVGTANFYNFMDGIDGIAGITGVVAFCLIGFFADNYVQQPAISLSAYGVAAACVGFLPFNMPKAKVFMGDVGSILLGFVFAVYLVLLSRSITDFLVVAGFLSTFYIDALTTLYVRKRDGEHLSQAHRRHLYQLLTNQLQIPHWKVSSCYGILQLSIGLLLLAIHPLGTGIVVGVIILLVAIWVVVMQKIRRAVEAW